ncbi:MAG: efflux RND transporter periplasmic adaptor subunit [Chloroflexota bacterium]
MKIPSRSLLVGLVLALTSVGMVGAQAQAQPSNILDQTPVEQTDLRVTVNATGEIDPARSVPLTFGVLAPVSAILVTEGQTVHAGDVLAKLDTSDLELGVRSAQIGLQQQQVRFDQLTSPARDVDIAVAQSAVNVAQASANAAYSTAPSADDLEIARLRTEIARNQLWQSQIQRDQTLAVNPEFRASHTNDPESQAAVINAGLEQADIGISIAQTNYDGLNNQGPDVSRLSQANASIVQATVQLDKLMNGANPDDVRLAQIALENSTLAVEQAQLQLDDSVITAPFDGLVIKNNLVVGELPTAGQPAFELVDSSSMIVNVLVDETNIAQVEVGQTATFELDALPDSNITGKVSKIALMPVTGTTVPSYEVEIVLDPTSDPVHLGMSTTASITIAEVKDALVVPNRFIRLDSATQQATVTVLDANNHTREVVVTLGQRNETESQVVTGLEAGQIVVLVDQTNLPQQRRIGSSASS